MVDGVIGQISVAMSGAHALVFGVSTAAGAHYGRMVATVQARVDHSTEALWRVQSILHHLPNAVIVQPLDGDRREVAGGRWRRDCSFDSGAIEARPPERART